MTKHFARPLSACGFHEFGVRTALLIAATAGLAFSTCFGASTYTWAGPSGGTWNGTNNYGKYPGGLTGTVYPVAGDTVVFNGNVDNQNETIYLNGNEAANAVDFQNTGTTSFLGGVSGTAAVNTLTLTGGINVFAGSGAVTFGDTSASQPTDAVNLVFTASQGVANNSINTLTLANTVMGSNAGTGVLTLTLAGSGNINIGGGITSIGAGTGAVALTKNGSGTLTLSGTVGNTYTGTTTLIGGTVNLDESANLQRLSAGALALGGVSLNFTNASATASTGTLTVGGTSLTAGGSVITDTSNETIALGALTRANTTLGATLGITPNTSGSGVITTSSTGSNGILGGYAVYGKQGTADWAVGSTTAISGLGTYTTLVTTGGSNVTNYQTDPTVTTTTLTGATSVFTLKIVDPSATPAMAGTLDLGGFALTVGGTTTIGGVLYTGSNGYTISDGTLKVGSSAAADFIFQQYGSGNLTVSATIANGTTTTALTKSGPGTLTLSGSNTYSGATYIVGGTLAIGGTTTSALGTSTSATAPVFIGDNGTLDISANGAETFSGLSSITASNALGATGGSVVLGANTLLLGNSSSTVTSTFGGVISGSGGITKSNNNNQSLTGLSTYTGATTISGGTLNVGTFANAGTASSIGAELSTTSLASDLVIDTGILQYTGFVSQSTNRLFTIGQFATFDGSGSTIVPGLLGTMNFTNTGAISFTAASLGSSHILTLTGTNAGTVGTNNGGGINGSNGDYSLENTIAAQVTDDSLGGTTAVFKTSAGSWTLTNSNSTFSGGTTVSGGRLIAIGTDTVTAGTLVSGPLGTGTVTASGLAQIILAGGTYANAFSLSGTGFNQSGNASGGVGTIPGVLVLNNGANVSGTVTLNADTLISGGFVYANLSSVTANQGTISGQITGGFQLFVGNAGATSGGTLTLSNTTNNFTGGVTVEESSTSGGSTSALVIGTGAGNGVIPHGFIPSTTTPYGNVTLLDPSSSGTIVFALNGNSITINGLSATGTSIALHGSVSNNSATAATLTVGDGNASASYAGTIVNTVNNGFLPNPTATGALAIAKIGTGTQTFTNVNSYSGGTTISAGNLQLTNAVATVASAASGTGTGALTLSGGTAATISGTGTAVGLLTATNGSRIAPGINVSGANSNFGVAGTLYLGTNGTYATAPSNGLTLTSASLDFDLSSTGGTTVATTTSDLIITKGTLTLGTVNFTFNPLTGTLDTSVKYVLIAGATQLGGTGLAGITGTVIGGGYTPVFSFDTTSVDNLDVTFTTAVPEPSALALELVALALGSAWYVRRRSRRAGILLS